MPGEQASDATPTPAAGRRSAAVRALVTITVVAAAGGALMLVAPPDRVAHQIAHMRVSWLLAALVLELGSCLCYPVVFRRFFPEPPAAVSRRVAWIAMGAGAILPGGNISSAAATGWLLRRHGIGMKRLLERCGALLCLLTLFGFVVNGVAAAVLALGLTDGPHDLLRTGGPIAVSTVVLLAAAGCCVLTRRLGARAPLPLRALGGALWSAWDAVRSPNPRLLGGAGYLLLDIAALDAACAATGHPIGPPAVAVAYCIGYLATVIPVPAGIAVLDSGLAAALVLYRMPGPAAVGAVLVYHAISIWLPGVGGLIAWLPGRRARSMQPVPASA